MNAQNVQTRSGQLGKICSDSNLENTKNGEIYLNQVFFKKYAILLRDTCSPFNRFTNCYVRNNQQCPVEYYYKAALVDSYMAIEAESFLAHQSKNEKTENGIEQFSFSKNSFYNYIRLYGGFFDDRNEKYVVIQFLTQKEFARDKRYYTKYFNFFAQRTASKLRFLILKFNGDVIAIQSRFGI